MAILTDAALKNKLAEKKSPVNFAWSRLEVSPRTKNFERALKAEVRDAMWMLAKQWQMGEFEGDDCGSPITAKISTSSSLVNKYQAAANEVQPFDDKIPFEAKVERRQLPFETLEQDISLDLRLLIGRRWFRILDDDGLLNNPVKDFFLAKYKIKQPDPTLNTDAIICSDIESWQYFAAVSGRMMDGGKLYLDLIKAVSPAYFEDATFPDPGNIPRFQTANGKLTAWFNELYIQPDVEINNAWKPEQLEYQFAISSNSDKGEKIMTADEYYHGHLDWYNVDVNPDHEMSSPVPKDISQKKVSTIIPAPVVFEGMPNNRWWAFEDSKTNFSFVKPDKTDLAKLIVIEFALVYANDWYLIPFKLPAGSVSKINGLSICNVFGEKFWIGAAGSGNNSDWQKWNMFSMHVAGKNIVRTDNDLLLLPTVPKIQQGKPTEEIVFVRDEMANMVWAIESIVPTPSGKSRRGNEASDAYHNFLQNLIGPLPALPVIPAPKDEEVAKISYEIMNNIPENWIPFIPTHKDDDKREVQLQRAAMPRILVGGPAKADKIRPRSFLLQDGLKDKKAYFIYEEEIPRSGIIVNQSYKRTRWYNGKTIVWYGVNKTNGRGEGSSGLGFDLIVKNKKL